MLRHLFEFRLRSFRISGKGDRLGKMQREERWVKIADRTWDRQNYLTEKLKERKGIMKRRMIREREREELWNQEMNWREMVADGTGRDIAQKTRRTGRRMKTVGRMYEGEVEGMKSQW